MPPRRRRWPGARILVFIAALIAYIALSYDLTLAHSPLLRLDYYLYHLHLRHRYPALEPWVLGYVTLGQRGPATLAALPYFGWVAWRTRSARPFVMLVTSLLLLNVSVGVVKLLIGRIGPRQTNNPFDLFAGGNIYPSGHVSNTVVLYGLIAWISLGQRRRIAAAAAFISITVGLGTVFANTHWLSDVVGGWLAGALVLLLLPTVMPTCERWADAAIARVRARWRRRRAQRVARRQRQRADLDVLEPGAPACGPRADSNQEHYPAAAAAAAAASADLASVMSARRPTATAPRPVPPRQPAQRPAPPRSANQRPATHRPRPGGDEAVQWRLPQRASRLTGVGADSSAGSERRQR